MSFNQSFAPDWMVVAKILSYQNVCGVVSKAVSWVSMWARRKMARPLVWLTVFLVAVPAKDINKFVAEIGRSDLQITDSIKFTPVEVPEFFGIEEDEIDDDLNVIPMRNHGSAALRTHT